MNLKGRITMNTKVFEDAKVRFIDALSYYVAPEDKITYEVWVTIPESMRAVALYVAFYPEVMIALSKSTAAYIPDEDLLSFLLQYLQKNVGKMTKRRYTPSYMYSIAYNCMAAPRRNKTPQKRFELEIPQYANTSDGELDRFTTYVDDDALDMEELVANKEIWDIIQTASTDVKEVIYNILDHTRLPKHITKSKKAEIIRHLRKTCVKYRQLYADDNTMRFSSVVNNDDCVESAVVEMQNGDLAVYYGEKKELNNTEYYVFFGATRDYFVPFDTAIDLKVLDVQLY